MSSLDEFDIIATYFKRPVNQPSVVLGSGDDCAVVCPPRGQQLLVTTDTLNVNTHFFSTTLPYHIATKAVSVSLSDIAAMGGKPMWLTLSLTLPDTPSHWLQNFSEGLYDQLAAYDVALIGGNLTKGPLSVTTQVVGCVEPHHYLKRSGAQVGDLIYVTGDIGDGGLALAVLQDRGQFVSLNQNDYETLIQHMWQPTPRIIEGQELVSVATSAIDLSDGLLADLGHVLDASSVGAYLRLEDIPVSSVFAKLQPRNKVAALTSGDDYELCFTVPPQKRALVEAISHRTECKMTCIGFIQEGEGIRLYHNETELTIPRQGYKHFG